LLAGAVLGAGDSSGSCVSQLGDPLLSFPNIYSFNTKKMPAMVDALSGKPLLQQDITIDMSEAAKFGKQQSDELRKGLLQCFIADD
jgi:hypothetical protein